MEQKSIEDFLAGKSEHTVCLYNHFIQQYLAISPVSFHPAKTMIGIANGRKRIAYITQLGKSFIHVVFHFKKPYQDNLCFQKITGLPGSNRFNHHFRMYEKEDVNDEVQEFMKMAYNEEH